MHGRGPFVFEGWKFSVPTSLTKYLPRCYRQRERNPTVSAAIADGPGIKKRGMK
jgi:hypothetical protein